MSAGFAVPLLLASAVGLPLAAWLGDRHLDGFVDRVGAGVDLALPLALTGVVTVLVTAVAALRHVRLTLAIQPIEALH